MLKNVLTVMLGTFSSRVFGLLRQAVFNALFPDALKDAFNVAYRVPNLLRELLAEGAVQNALIPVLKGLSEEEARRFSRRFGAFLLGINLMALGLGYLFAPQIALLLVAPGSHLREAESFQQVVFLIRLLLPFLLFISMAALFSALLQAQERFGPSSFAPVAFNLVSILLMALWPQDPTALGLSVTLGGVFQALIQLPFLKGFFLEWGFHPAFKTALFRMGPFVFTTSLRQFLNLVLVNILTRYPQAAVTGFYNAEVVFQMVLGLFATSPAMALFPRLSTLAREDPGGFARLLEGALARMAFFLGLLGGGLTGLAPYLVVVLFGLFGPLSPENRTYSAQVLMAMGFAVLPWGLNTLLLRGLYALGRVAEAVLVSALVFAVNTLGYWALREGGLFALNLATALAGYLGFLLYLRLLSRARVGLRRGVLAWARAFLPGLGAAGLGVGVQALWPATTLKEALPPLVLGGVGSVLTYLGLAWLIGVPVRALLSRRF
ncbi:MAG: murein biosynthesis integral membrane protein MurJ [Thermus sp.]|uniref:murein biosynthesis integral membrane protein MurJ n=1 Tax=Thermus sp. TaxID=275 RepID=UPI003320D44B